MSQHSRFLVSGPATMLLGALFVSVGSALIKLAGTRLPALEIVFARSFFMVFYCWILARRAGAHIPGHDKRFLVLRGLLGFGAYVCVFYAVINMPLADALVIVYSFPLAVPIMAGLFLGERLERQVVLCSLIGASGMLLVAKPSFLFGTTSDLAPLAVAAAFGAAAFSSSSVVCIRKLTSTEHPLVIVLYAAGLSALGAPLLDGWNWVVPTWGELALLLGIGLFMSAGQHFITVAFGKAAAGRASVLFYFQVVFGAFFGYLLFDEVPDAFTVAGAALIIGGAVALAVFRRR